MSNFVYTNAKRAILAGEIDWASDDIRALAVMSNTTADTEEDTTTISGFSTLDEFDGSGYTRQTLAGKTVTADNTNDRGVFDANDAQFTNISAGSRAIVGFLVYKHVTNDTDAIPLLYIDTVSGIALPFTPNGGSVIIQWSASGVLYA